MMNILYKPFAQFRRCERGNTAIMVGIALWVLVAAAGVAIDMTRLQTDEQKLHECLDAAGLAALGKIDQTPSSMTPLAWATQNVNEYFYTNCAKNYLKSTNLSIKSVLSDFNNTLSLTLTGQEQTTLMPIIGIHMLDLNIFAEVTRDISGMEIVFVIDNSDSMANSIDSPNSNTSISKLQASQCAIGGDTAAGAGVCAKGMIPSTGMLDKWYGNKNTLPNVFFSMVPFAGMVNINAQKLPGSAFLAGKYKASPLNAIYNSDCVDSRDPTKISTVDKGIKDASGNPIKITMDISEDAPSPSNPTSYFIPISKTELFGKPCNIEPMLVDATNKSDVITALQNMTPTILNNGTIMNLGLAWGWRTISPDWQGKWGAAATYTNPANGAPVPLPLPYGTPNMAKILVLASDGLNYGNPNSAYIGNWCANAAGQPTGQLQCPKGDTLQPGNSCTDAAGKVVGTGTCPSGNLLLPNWQLPAGPPSNAQNPLPPSLNALTRNACDAMKSKGITIYTVAYGPQAASGQASFGVDYALMKYCATAATVIASGSGSGSGAGAAQQYFYAATSNVEVSNAYQQITQQIATTNHLYDLRIEK